MPFKIFPQNSQHASVSLPNGWCIPKEGCVVAELPVDFSKWKQFLKVVILPTAEESATDKANVATKGAVYEGVGTVVVHGIEGGFTCGVPRFNLSDEELCLAEQSAGILRIVWRD